MEVIYGSDKKLCARFLTVGDTVMYSIELEGNFSCERANHMVVIQCLAI